MNLVEELREMPLTARCGATRAWLQIDPLSEPGRCVAYVNTPERPALYRTELRLSQLEDILESGHGGMGVIGFARQGTDFLVTGMWEFGEALHASSEDLRSLLRALEGSSECAA